MAISSGGAPKIPPVASTQPQGAAAGGVGSMDERTKRMRELIEAEMAIQQKLAALPAGKAEGIRGMLDAAMNAASTGNLGGAETIMKSVEASVDAALGTRPGAKPPAEAAAKPPSKADATPAAFDPDKNHATAENAEQRKRMDLVLRMADQINEQMLLAQINVPQAPTA